MHMSAVKGRRSEEYLTRHLSCVENVRVRLEPSSHLSNVLVVYSN